MARAKRTEDAVTVEHGSGNVFADIGLPDPDTELAKARLAFEIRQIISARGLTQAEAGDLLGLDQPKVSQLVNGRLQRFSVERLVRALNDLGHDIEIVIKGLAEGRGRGRVQVLGHADEPPRQEPML